jgi:hypothetical protein
MTLGELASRPAGRATPTAPGWVRGLGMCCYVAAGLCLVVAVILPILALVVFIIWLRLVVGAAVQTATSAISLSLYAPDHDPLGGTAAMVVVIGSAVVAGLGLSAVILLVIEAVLVVSALILFLIGRRLRRARPAGPVR